MGITEYCEEVFFDAQLNINTTNPTFSNCFQQLVLILPPCVYLWLLALPYYFTTHRSQQSYIFVSLLFKLKVCFTIFLWVLAWIDLVANLWVWGQSVKVPSVDLVTPLIVGSSMALAVLMTQFDRMKGVRSSGLLTGFWFLLLVTWGFVFKEKVVFLNISSVHPLSDLDVVHCVTFFLSYIAVLINFILCFFADNPPSFPSKESEKREELSSLLFEDTKDVKRDPSPQEDATFVSRITFWWFNNMIFTGFKRPLVDSDLWKLNHPDCSSVVTAQFMKNWNHELAAVHSSTGKNVDKDVEVSQPSKKQRKASLLKAMVKTFGPYFLIGTFLKILQDILAFVSPQLLSYLIAFISSNAPTWHGYVLAAALFVTAMVQSVILQQYFHICFVVGMRLRSAIIAAIYRKALLLSNSAKKQSTVGEIVNLMSVDAQRFMDLMSYLNILWSGPFQIILALYFLWRILGPSVLAGLAVMILLIPINAVFASKAKKLQVKQMNYKDDRIKLMNEILNGIKVLKMYAWEMSFKDKISEIRRKELRQLRRAAYLNAISSFTFICAPFMVSVTTFAVYVLSDDQNILDAQKAFVSLSLFNLLRFPLTMLPMIVTSIVQASVSLQRLQTFLNHRELDPESVDRREMVENKTVLVEQGSFRWDAEGKEVLSDVSFSVEQGSLVAVVGQVGCGKSSLISALLGDMDHCKGRVAVKGSVAYVPQQAWIQNLTCRDNVTFGSPLDHQKYKKTVEVCELNADFEMLPGGDLTEIGERGINLSGGQKQRIAMARAVYQDADIYLLDDPLSAVDAHVGRNIFDHVIGPDGCLKGKTRILVTHGLSFLPQVDRIYVMVNGTMSEVGSYEELLARNGAFADFLRTYTQTDGETDGGNGQARFAATPELLSVKDVEELEMEAADVRRSLMSRPAVGPEQRRSICKEASKGSTPLKDGKKLIQAEKAETGNVKPAVFKNYVSAIGCFSTLLIVSCYCLQNGAQIGSSIWLSAWSNDPLNPDGTRNGTDVRLGIYSVFGVCQGIFTLLSTVCLYVAGLEASRTFHYHMLIRVLRAPMSFFDQTPTGRLISRFSKDVDVMDGLLITTISMFISSLLRVIGTIFIICFATPFATIAFVPTMLLYILIQRFYVKTSRQLKRLESVSRSPIFSHFGESLTGAASIRAYGLQRSFIKQNERKIDANLMCYYPSIVSNRWLALRLEFIGNLIILFAAVFAVAARDLIDAGLAGLSVSYAMQITQTLNWLVRQTSELETNIVAVERVQEYAHVEQEASLVSEKPPADYWPSSGQITFNQYSARYREELDLVVKNINADITGGEKIGIVGRTGAGKSSLTLALFRVIEAADGWIEIDGINISKIGLQELRSRISIIPQDPVLFSGSLRMNLDPFDRYNDDAIWNALEHSHLKSFVSSLPTKLDFTVTEGGDNLSVGQRQLVCLARALLRKSKILVLDEATAAVDMETDDLIQATIRSEFAGCTIFTIAHRLNTIMDNTRVLVLDGGKVAELDSPSNLIKHKGIFYAMAKDAGLV